MEQEINVGYTITDRLAVGNYEFVIGQSNTVPGKYVTWKCKKGEKDYFWGHYLRDRLSAIEDLCRRAIEEVELLRTFQPTKDTNGQPERQAGKKRREPER
ncbi:MAG: hypothetical protein ACYCX2_03765 [Christensenellales bacterium]